MGLGGPPDPSGGGSAGATLARLTFFCLGLTTSSAEGAESSTGSGTTWVALASGLTLASRSIGATTTDCLRFVQNARHKPDTQQESATSSSANSTCTCVSVIPRYNSSVSSSPLVGMVEGAMVVGAVDGTDEVGAAEGICVVGEVDGAWDTLGGGVSVVGEGVVGTAVVGVSVGTDVGLWVGTGVGTDVGVGVGSDVGALVGASVNVIPVDEAVVSLPTVKSVRWEHSHVTLLLV